MWEQRWFGKNQELCGIIEHGSDDCDTLVISLPGLGQAMSEKNYLFSNLRKHLAEKGQKYIQFDYKGFGDSTGEMGESSLQTMFEDGLSVLKDACAMFKPRNIYLIGNALGTVIASRLSNVIKKFYQVDCKVIGISPLITPLPKSTSLFSESILKRLRGKGSIDSQELVSGFDYYTLSDFNLDQHKYVTRLGSHMLYLHGQRISNKLIDELDQLNPIEELQSADDLTLIIGEKDSELNYAQDISQVFMLNNVEYFYQHPSAMDQVFQIVESIIFPKNKCKYCKKCNHNKSMGIKS
ncbi:alpha/beta hydrolase [Bacillus sp. SM2101]|uniref:serine aminopeptidase domain-containing protein n=1 Tax=Bacillus sp. SM2101 TaxID=2805366 RepID=UPI001BDE979E|nr:alpha/beta hydrolase [Bacillus sp. SM2101]